jgi:hypothetical protein
MLDLVEEPLDQVALLVDLLGERFDGITASAPAAAITSRKRSES